MVMWNIALLNIFHMTALFYLPKDLLPAIYEMFVQISSSLKYILLFRGKKRGQGRFASGSVA